MELDMNASHRTIRYVKSTIFVRPCVVLYGTRILFLPLWYCTVLKLSCQGDAVRPGPQLRLPFDRQIGAVEKVASYMFN